MSDLFSIEDSEIKKLPDSIKKSLNLHNKTFELQTMIYELLKIAGRPLSVKELIIGLYKKYGYEVHKRNNFACKLSRMVTAKKIISDPKMRGYYCLPLKTKRQNNVKLYN